MDLNDFNKQDDNKGQVELNEQNYQEKNKYNIFGKNYFIGLASGVLVFVLVCSVFPSVNSTFRNINNTMLQNFDDTSVSSLEDGTTGNDTYGKDQKNVQKKIDEIYDVLDKYYVTDYEKEDTLEGIYAGLVDSIGDPYTSYMSATEFEAFLEDTEGTYAGIGISVSVDTEDNSIVIISTFEGFPGAEAGLMPGDKIAKVNDDDVSGDTLDKAISIMKGEPGTTVDITIYRPSENQMIDLTVMREKIDVPTVSHEMLEDDIAYIRITQFDRVTYNQFESAFNDVKDDMKGLIIDLRNNPGGLLNVVTDITDLLIPEGTIVYTEDKNGKKIYTESGPDHIEVPLLVLVNGYSASASEVLSGAVKDTGVGQLVGERTFGKGLVQNVFGLKDESAVKITIAKYYTPSGVCIQGEGIEPDYPIEMDMELSVRISSLTMDEDVQLKRAVEVMNEKMGS